LKILTAGHSKFHVHQSITTIVVADNLYLAENIQTSYCQA